VIRQRLRRHWPRIALLAFLGGTLVALWLSDPGGRFWPRCPFHWLTGLHCPGCGSLRGLHHILQGDFQLGLRHNVFLPLSLVLLAWLFVPRSWHERWRAWTHPHADRAAWVLLMLLLVFGVARNIPFAPFTLLAPP